MNVLSIRQYQNTYSLSVRMLVTFGNTSGTNRYGYGVYGIFRRYLIQNQTSNTFLSLMLMIPSKALFLLLDMDHSPYLATDE